VLHVTASATTEATLTSMKLRRVTSDAQADVPGQGDVPVDVSSAQLAAADLGPPIAPEMVSTSR
jgi:hypothetical protein